MKPDKKAIPRTGEVLSYVRQLGPRRALWRGTYVLANQAILLTIMDCWYLRPEHVNRSIVEPGESYSGRFLEPKEADVFAKELDAAGQRVLHEAFAHGSSCYAVLDGSRLANIGFYSSEPTPVMNDLLVHFEEPSWYMYGAYTPKDYRGLGLHGRGILGACLELFDRGVPGLVTLSERTNYRAVGSAYRVGWQHSGSVYRVGIGPFTHIGRSARARELGMYLALRSDEPTT